MPLNIKAWDVTDTESIRKLPESNIVQEYHLEQWIKQDCEIVASDWLPICIRPTTDYGTVPDYLGISSDGSIVIVELKKEAAPRDVIAQAIEYAAWVSDKGYDEIIELATRQGSGYFSDEEEFKEAFNEKFKHDLPEVINEEQRIVIVATEFPDRVARAVEYLAENYSMPINVVKLYLKKDRERTLLMQTTVLPEDDAVTRRASSKRQAATTWSQVLTLAEENGTRKIAMSLHDKEIEGVNFSKQYSTNGFSCAVQSGDVHRTILSVAFNRPGNVVFSFKVKNLTTIAGLSTVDCKQKLRELGVGSALDPTPEYERITCSTIDDADKLFDRAFEIFVFEANMPAATDGESASHAG